MHALVWLTSRYAFATRSHHWRLLEQSDLYCQLHICQAVYAHAYADNTSLFCMQAALRQATAAEPQAPADFLANLSHDVMTPLHAVLACSQLLLDGSGGHVQLHAEQRELVEVVDAAGKQLFGHLAGLLESGKPQTAQV